MYHPKIDGGIYQCIHSFKPNQLIEKMYNSEAVHGKWHFYGETLSGNWDVTSLGCIQYQQYPQTKTPNYPPLTPLPVWLLAHVIWLQKKTIVDKKIVKMKIYVFFFFATILTQSYSRFEITKQQWLHSVGFHRSASLLHISNLALVIWLQQKTIVEERVVKEKKMFFSSFTFIPAKQLLHNPRF